VEADLRGVHFHGVIRVPTYVQGITAGTINSGPKFQTVEDHGGQVMMAGDGYRRVCLRRRTCRWLAPVRPLARTNAFR
jgi:LDH2 family malate/lactate/ureidoglycolate dehydrogenase